MVKSYHFAQCRPISVWNWTERSRIVITLIHYAKNYLRALRCWGDLRVQDGALVPRHCSQLPCPLSTRLLSTLYQLGVAARILASLRAFLNDALRILSRYLHPTLTNNLPILSDIQPAGLRRQGATLFLDNCSSLNPGHILSRRLLARRDWNLKTRLFLPRGNYCTTYLSWAFALPNRRTWRGTQSTPRVCQHSMSTFLGLTQGLLQWVWPKQFGSNSIACVLALGVSVRQRTNGVSLLQRNASVPLENKLQTTLF